MSDVKQDGFSSYSLENVALGLLMSSPKHGYGLYRDFTVTFRRIWKAGQANFYAALARLEAKGHLRSIAEPQEGRPARKVYQITDSGREAFMVWLHTPVPSLRAIRVELIAKLRFFHVLQLPGTSDLIDGQIVLLRSMLAEWDRNADQPEKAELDPFPALIDDFRKRQAEFVMEWLIAWQEHFQVNAGAES
ncbi:MAG: PadR family transcriptional regulator [Anaerolineae bacterium]|nr:PadR family transcriptional regulator [Anaerolineae bacterium]